MKTTPSQASRWVPCPGSAYLESLYPRTATHPVTEEGKAIHWACEGVARSWVGTARTLASYVGQACPENGIVITDEMVVAGNVYLAAVWERAQINPAGLKVEQQLTCHPYGLELAGRADAVWHTEDKRWFSVFDGKFGYGPVAAFENWQLLIYGLAIYLMYPQVETVELVIVQPRGESVRRPVKPWPLNRAQLADYHAYIADRKRLADLEANAPTFPGSHCRHCRAAHSCPALEEASWHAYELAGTAVPQELAPADIAYRLNEFERAGAMLRARRDALEDLAARSINSGTPVPGYAMHSSLGDRKWIDLGQAKALGIMNAVEMFERKPIGPAQAVARGIPELAVNALTSRSERPPKLVKAKV